MTEIALRELRNNTSEVLRRVENGEELDVTVNGRPGPDSFHCPADARR